MTNDLSQTIFYFDLKHVHKNGSAKFQPNPLFSSPQMGTENAGGRKKTSQQTHIVDPVGTGYPNKLPAGMTTQGLHQGQFFFHKS